MSSIVINRPTPTLHYPPTARGHWLFGTAPEFQKGTLQTMERMVNQYGPAVRIQFFANLYGFMFVHPDHNKHILQDNNRNYTKMPHPTFIIMEPVAGNGLLTSDGDFWRRQRRLAQPAFHRQHITGFGTTMMDAAQTMLEKWQPGNTIDLDKAMMALTLEIAGKTLFSMDLTREAEKVGVAFTAVSEVIAELAVKPFSIYTIKLPFWPSTRKIRQGTALLDEVVNKIIAGRRTQPVGTHHDLLAMLMEAKDEETGEQMSDKQLRDEVMTLLIAGHETTSTALSWAFAMLSQNPDVRQKLDDELREVLNGRIPTITDIPNLPYTKMVLEETMRLYPPAYAMSRMGHDADIIGGYDLPANSTLTLSPYLTHRLPEFWPQPEKFDPERFTPENSQERPRYAYIPFGGGPRQCIGNTFAMTEAILLLATIAQRYHLVLQPNHLLEPNPLVTLRPKNGLPMRISPIH